MDMNVATVGVVVVVVVIRGRVVVVGALSSVN